MTFSYEYLGFWFGKNGIQLNAPCRCKVSSLTDLLPPFSVLFSGFIRIVKEIAIFGECFLFFNLSYMTVKLERNFSVCVTDTKLSQESLPYNLKLRAALHSQVEMS